LTQGPWNAQGGLLVTDLDISPGDEIEEFPVGPQFVEVQRDQPEGGLICKVGGSLSDNVSG